MATMITVISDSNGRNYTTSTLVPNNITTYPAISSTVEFSLLGSTYIYGGPIGTINQTTFAKGGLSTMCALNNPLASNLLTLPRTWPTPFATLAALSLFKGESHSALPQYPPFLVPLVGNNSSIRILDIGFDSADMEFPVRIIPRLDPSLTSCRGAGNGVPTMQVPVSYLTDETTIYKGSHTTQVSSSPNSVASGESGAGSAGESPLNTAQATPGPTAAIPIPKTSSRHANLDTPAGPTGALSLVGGAQATQPPSLTNVIASGIAISILGSNIAIGKQTFSLGPISFGSPGGAYVVGSQTIIPGGVMTVNGEVLSYDQQGNSMIVEGSPYASGLAVPGGSNALTGAAENVVGGQTTVLGGSPITIDGTVISLPSAGGAGQYIVGGQTLVPGGSPITIGGTVISLPPAGSTNVPTGVAEYVIGGQTLVPGGPPITIDGTVISLAPAGTGGTSTGAPGYVIDGRTLVPGSPPITIDGTVISLAPSASDIVIRSKTEGVTVAPSQDVGGLTYSVFVPGDGATPTASGLEAFTGVASRIRETRSWALVAGVCFELLKWL